MGSLPPSSSSPNSIPPHAMPLVSPSALLSAHLSQTPPIRPSGRTPLQPNKIQLTTNSLTHTHGSSLVRIGGTTVVCGVRAEVLDVKDIPSWSVADGVTRTVEEWEAAEAGRRDADESTRAAATGVDDDDDNNEEQDNDDDDDEQREEKRDQALSIYNLLVPNLSLDTGCSPLHPANSAPSPEQMSITQRLLSLLLTSRLVRARDLEIYDEDDHPTIDAEEREEEDSMAVDRLSPTKPTPGLSLSSSSSNTLNRPKTIKAYYTLYIDLLALSYANSTTALFDAAWLATLAALKTTRLPHARWDADETKVVCSSDSQKAKTLRLRGMPVGVGFGVCELDRRVIEARLRRPPAPLPAAAAAGGDDGPSNPTMADGAVEKAEAARGAASSISSSKHRHKVLLLDLEGMEEECCAETGCVVVDCARGTNSTNSSANSGAGAETTLVRVEKTGGGFVDIEALKTVVEAAEARWSEWMTLMDGQGL